MEMKLKQTIRKMFPQRAKMTKEEKEQRDEETRLGAAVIRTLEDDEDPEIASLRETLFGE